MTSVKADEFPADERHVQMLIGLLFNRIHEALGTAEEEGWHGLRKSHVRVMQGVPPTGTNITDLAHRIGLTKQGCGQLVTQLVELGQLSEEADPDDRRVRLIRRTEKGQRAMAEFRTAVNTLEGDFAREVGTLRWRTFKGVLEDLVL